MTEFCLNNENAVEKAMAEYDQGIDNLQKGLQPEFENKNLIYDEIGNKLDQED